MQYTCPNRLVKGPMDFNMTTLFKISSGILLLLFLFYGMDVRMKKGAKDFVAPVWQLLMKVCSFSLVAIFAGITVSVRHLHGFDWIALTLMVSGTGFVVLAKRKLGKAHTFTGQFLEKPRLVTKGVYGITRNPLYFGVLQCESGAALLAFHQLPLLIPRSYSFYLGILALALLYAVSFNWIMAVREARYLERCFGEDYRRYSSGLPFVIPWITLRKEVK